MGPTAVQMSLQRTASNEWQRAIKQKKNLQDHSDDSFCSSKASSAQESSVQSPLILRSCLRQVVPSSSDHGVPRLESANTSTSSHASVKISHAETDSGVEHKSFASSFKRPRGVRFHSVKVREYEQVISDNPSCSSGAPIRYDIKTLSCYSC